MTRPTTTRGLYPSDAQRATHATVERGGAIHALCDSVEPRRIDPTVVAGEPTCARCLAKLAAPTPEAPAAPPAREAMIARARAVLATPRPTPSEAHAVARDVVELATQPIPRLGRPASPKVSPDSLLIERARVARGLTRAALAAEVGVSMSVLSRADVKPVPRRVRGLLREMLGEPGGEEPEGVK